VWDSAVDAAEFGSYLEEITTKRFRSATSSPTAGGHAYRVGDRTITVRGGEVQGRSSVLYTDLPAGINYGVQGSGGRGQ